MQNKNILLIIVGLIILIGGGVIWWVGFKPTTKEILYIKTENSTPRPGHFPSKSVKIISYDFVRNQKKIIREYNSDSISIYPINYPFSYLNNEFFFLINDTTDGLNPVLTILKVEITGKKPEIIELARLEGESYNEYISGMIISPDQKKIAYCVSPGTVKEEWRLVVYEFITNEKKVFGPGPFCIEGGYGVSTPTLVFSRDGKKIFYLHTVFIHPAEEKCLIEEEQCTEEEIKEMEKRIKKIKEEAGAGLRILDIETGQNVLLLPSWTEDWSLPIFYNDPQMNLKEKIYWQKKGGVEPFDIKEIEIKKIQNTDFDYLLQKQIDQLPTLSRLEVKLQNNRKFSEVILSEKGDGFFYVVYSAGYSRYGEVMGKELGFLEIETERDYFPLPFALKEIITQKEGFEPRYHWPWTGGILAFSKDALFYYVQFAEYDPAELRATKNQLYRISIDGKEELIDTAPYGSFMFVGFVEI